MRSVSSLEGWLVIVGTRKSLNLYKVETILSLEAQQFGIVANSAYLLAFGAVLARNNK